MAKIVQSKALPSPMLLVVFLDAIRSFTRPKGLEDWLRQLTLDERNLQNAAALMAIAAYLDEPARALAYAERLRDCFFESNDGVVKNAVATMAQKLGIEYALNNATHCEGNC